MNVKTRVYEIPVSSGNHSTWFLHIFLTYLYCINIYFALNISMNDRLIENNYSYFDNQ